MTHRQAVVSRFSGATLAVVKPLCINAHKWGKAGFSYDKPLVYKWIVE